MDNPELQKLINSVGITAELMKLLDDALQKAGFNEQQSLYLCGEVLKVFFVNNKERKG